MLLRIYLASLNYRLHGCAVFFFFAALLFYQISLVLFTVSFMYRFSAEVTGPQKS